jgi:hypothetical protein
LALSIAGALCSLPLFLTNAHAFGGPPGGPFSNGSYFPNDGTFSAVIRGFDDTENQNPLVGTVQFSTSTTSASGSTGISTIYYGGYSMSGNSQGSLNPASSSMTITFQANAEGQGQLSLPNNISTSNTTSTSFAEITGNKTTVNDFGFDETSPIYTITTTTSESTTSLKKQINFFDTFYISGYADCSTSNSFPNQKFNGTGNAIYMFLNYEDPQTPNTPVLYRQPINNLAVSGVRLTNIASNFNTASVRPPSVVQFTTEDATKNSNSIGTKIESP